MIAVFEVTFPFFALVLCGYLALRKNVLDESAIPGMNMFVLYFALPCLLFRMGASVPFSELVKPEWVGLYLLCALLLVGLVMGYGVWLGWNRGDAAFGSLVAAFPNTGFMGVPLIVALMGESTAGPVMVTMLVDFFITSSLCIALAQSGAQGSRWLASVAKPLRAALTNPLPWAIALGAVVAALDLSLPQPLEQMIHMLGQAASPVALFAIGAMVCRTQRNARNSTPAALLAPVVFAKLVVHPVLVLVLGLAIQGLGFALDRSALTAFVLAAALPSASNVSLLADRYQVDSDRIASIIVWTTALAFFTFSLTVGLLDVPALEQ